MQALVDGDILVYRIGYTTEQDEEWVAAARVDELIFSIMEETQATSSRLFLTSTDHSNYRFAIYPEYKAHRKQPKPKHYKFIREHLIDRYYAEVVYGEEADDALGYSQDKDGHTVIASIDKDLLMVPGKHYNFVKKEMYNITPQQGLYNFYWQLLNGDTGDNIPGCPGIGPKSIEKLIHSDMSEEELFMTTLNTYINQYNKKDLNTPAPEDMLRNGRLLKIKQQKDEPLWQFPNGQQVEQRPSSSPLYVGDLVAGHLNMSA